MDEGLPREPDGIDTASAGQSEPLAQYKSTGAGAKRGRKLDSAVAPTAERPGKKRRRIAGKVHAQSEPQREHLRAAEALRQANEILETIFSNVHVLIAYLDTDFNFIRVNQVYADADGQSPEYFVGKNHFRLYPNPENEAIFRRVIDSAQPFVVYEKPFIYPQHPERGVTYWDWSLTPVKDTDGKVVGLVLCIRDVTDRKRVEQALVESERRFRAIFDQAFQFIGLLSPDGTVLELNHAALGFGGLTWSEVVGRPLWETPLWTSDHARKALREAIARAAAGEFVRYMVEIQGAGGNVATIDFSLRPMKDDRGNVVMLIPEGRDITERRSLEREVLRVSEAERQRIGRDLHDSLGANLTGVACLGKVLQQRLAAKGLSDAVDAAEIVSLVNQAIEMTRSLAKGLCPVGVNPDALVHSLREFAGGVEERLGVSCVFSADPPVLVHDSTTASNVFRIVQEAVSNAVRHGNAKSVAIRFRRAEGGAVLTIEDDGVGLPEAVHRSEGLGLHIMRYRAGVIGASLDIRRGDGGGTIVTCRVPDSHLIGAGG